jgi:RNA polymerase sigma factor (sigma-70 family)
MAAHQTFELTAYAQRLIHIKAHQLVRQAAHTAYDEADIRQELLLRLLSRAHHFDPQRGALNTFVDRVTRSAAASLVRQWKCKKRTPGQGVVSVETSSVLSPEGLTTLDGQLAPEDLARRTGGTPADPLAALTNKDAVRAAIAQLPAELQAVCERLMHVSPAAAARELGMSRDQITRALRKLRTHFAAADLA